MYEHKKFVDIVNAIIKGYKQHHDRFLDERRTEWANRVDKRFRRKPVGSDFESSDPDANERLQLMKRIIKKNEKYCRRDMQIPTLEFEEQMKLIEKLVNLRKKKGLTEPHGTILSEKANLLMLKGKYKDAQTELNRAISLEKDRERKKEPPIVIKRDNVRYLIDYVRCLYMQGEFDAAIAKSNEARRLASNIPINEEEDVVKKCIAAPELEFMPIAVHAYFAACDALIHHERWNTDDQLQREFTGLWNDAVTKHNVPQVWRTPIKIAVLSDNLWVSRTKSYVHDIAEKLYVDMGENFIWKIGRIVQTKWGGFNIDYDLVKTPAVAAAFLVLFMLTLDPLNLPDLSSPKTTKTIETVLKGAGIQADGEELKASVVQYFPSNLDLETTAEEFIRHEIQSGGIETTRTPILQFASSGSEGSVHNL